MKVLDLKKLINDKKTGAYFINISDKEILEKKINEAKEEGLFHKNKIAYTYTIHENYIVLILSKSIYNLMKGN